LGITLFGHAIFKSISATIIIEYVGFFNFWEVLNCILFPKDTNKASKIALPIVYSLYIFMFSAYNAIYEEENENNTSCPNKKLNTKDSKYKIIKIIDAKVNN
jgi:hypothetical protein